MTNDCTIASFLATLSRTRSLFAVMFILLLIIAFVFGFACGDINSADRYSQFENEAVARGYGHFGTTPDGMKVFIWETNKSYDNN
jgi:hypothetical protein